MIKSLSIQQYGLNNTAFSSTKRRDSIQKTQSFASASLPVVNPQRNSLNINTTLNQNDLIKYNYLVNAFVNYPISQNAEGLSCNQQLDLLLRNGKLLSKANDNSTLLDNLYLILTERKGANLDSKKLVSSTLDTIVNPRIITQTFGDIPNAEKQNVLSKAAPKSEVKKDSSLMNVTASGTCAAASNEVNLADKYPAEFARWINGLSSERRYVDVKIKLNSISQNPLDAITILDLMEANVTKFGFDEVTLRIKTDDNAYLRAEIQDKYWDPGERTVSDVLIQSAIMQTGSQNTYDSLTDTREGKFNSNPQGLIEPEKTFVESIIKNKEVTSLVYHIIDENRNLVGYTCDFDKIEKHIKEALDSGDNVINGYVVTNETSGRVASGMYNKYEDGDPNHIINGHEITIVGYRIDSAGKTIFKCIDTDDNYSGFVEYSADWLIPKLHHAGYDANLVAGDEKEIMDKALSAA